MYNNDFVAVLRVGGKILREDKNTVYVPYGSEYSVYMKNLRGRKAVVSISIDGEDVCKGKRIIVNGNDTAELERFLDDLNKGNKFKFIQKTSKIQEHRGDKIDDGIVRIEFQFEEEPKPVTHFVNYNRPSWSGDYPAQYTTFEGSADIRPKGMTLRGASMSLSAQSMNASYSARSATLDSFVPQEDEGITVRGSESNQTFRQGYIGPLETEKHVITLQLKGVAANGNNVEEVVTVQTKKTCTTCGTINEYNDKYCSECGTYL
jgi:hypothetical protein